MAETFLMDFVFDIKNWLEPYLNGIKNHVYPHSYTFFKKDGKVQMKYKAWANDKGAPWGVWSTDVKWHSRGDTFFGKAGIPQFKQLETNIARNSEP